MIDSHIHLDADQYDDPDEVIKQGAGGCLRGDRGTGVSPASNRKALALAAEQSRIYPAAALHQPLACDIRRQRATINDCRASPSSSHSHFVVVSAHRPRANGPARRNDHDCLP